MQLIFLYLSNNLKHKNMPPRKPKEQHKKRIVFLIPPDEFELVTEADCKVISKTAIKKEYRKRLKNKER